MVYEAGDVMAAVLISPTVYNLHDEEHCNCDEHRINKKNQCVLQARPSTGSDDAEYDVVINVQTVP